MQIKQHLCCFFTKSEFRQLILNCVFSDSPVSIQLTFDRNLTRDCPGSVTFSEFVIRLHRLIVNVVETFASLALV